jgi:hypothetical protein
MEDCVTVNIVTRALNKLINGLRNSTLIIFGERPVFKLILDLAKETGIQNKIFYLGVRSDSEELVSPEPTDLK